jgi:hypothetical protein
MIKQNAQPNDSLSGMADPTGGNPIRAEKSPEYSGATMFLRIQLLYDTATRVIVYFTYDGPRAELPEVSEDLRRLYYTKDAPESFTRDTVLDHVLTEELFDIRRRENRHVKEMPRLLLLSAKCKAMSIVLNTVASKRRAYTKNLPFQAEIYEMKEREARQYKHSHAKSEAFKSGCQDASNYPFLNDYAGLHNMDPIDVAELVLFKADEKAKVLEVTEHQRVYWTKQILVAGSMEQLEQVTRRMSEERFT